MTLYEQLRDAPANCMIPLQHGVGTPTVALTEPARAAVLNLIEAAQPLADLPYPHSADERMEWLTYQQKLREALAVFVSGQEEPQ